MVLASSRGAICILKTQPARGHRGRSERRPTHERRAAGAGPLDTDELRSEPLISRIPRGGRVVCAAMSDASRVQSALDDVASNVAHHLPRCVCHITRYTRVERALDDAAASNARQALPRR